MAKVKSEPISPSLPNADLVSVLTTSLGTSQEKVARLEKELALEKAKIGNVEKNVASEIKTLRAKLQGFEEEKKALSQEKDSLLAELSQERRSSSKKKEEAEAQAKEITRLNEVIANLEAETETLKQAKIKYRERAKAYKEQLEAAKNEIQNAPRAGASANATVQENKDSRLIIDERQKMQAALLEHQEEISTMMTVFKTEITKLYSLPKGSSTRIRKLETSQSELSSVYEEMSDYTSAESILNCILDTRSFKDVLFSLGRIPHVPGTPHYLAILPFKYFDLSMDTWSSAKDYSSFDGEVKELFAKSPAGNINYFGTFKCHYNPEVNTEGYALPYDMKDIAKWLADATLTPQTNNAKFAKVNSEQKIKDAKALIEAEYLLGAARVVCVGLQAVGYNQPLVDALISRIGPVSLEAPVGKRTAQSTEEEEPPSKRKKGPGSAPTDGTRTISHTFKSNSTRGGKARPFKQR